MPKTTPARRFPALLLTVVAACVMALVASMLGTPAQASTPSARAGASTAAAKPAPKVKRHDRVWRAQAALARAQKAVSPNTPAAERPDATLALRNLWLLKDSLSPAQKKVARSLAKRPNKPAVIGDANILLHFDPAELDPTSFDQNQALATLQYVADTYAGSGYRRPKPDKGRGGDNRIDIYLDQLPAGLYGYCTTDQNVRPPKFDVWAYCVLDADYAGFPAHTPLQNLQVTAAHEYYHATQFAYDIADDGWFLEATATWAEDELFDDVNDNVQYLRRSPLTLPRRPMDKFEDGGVFHYGVWLFFRYLTERYPAETGALPTLLLSMWQNADSSRGPRKDKYSVQAIDKALKAQHTSLAEQFTNFSAVDRFPAVFSEGVAEGYPAKRLSGQAALAPGKAKGFKVVLDHLTSSTYSFAPGGATTNLKLKFKMAPKSRGSRAVVVVVGTNGAFLDFRTIKLSRKGTGKASIPFAAGTVASVEVTLANASTKMRQCYRHNRNPVSCSGRAVFDNQRAMVKGKAS